MNLAVKIPGSDTDIQAPPGVPTGGLNTSGLPFIQGVIQILLVVGIVFALIMILWSSLQWIMSEGDKQKLQNARNRLIFSIVGLVVVLASFFILNTVGGLLGVENLTNPH